MRADKITPEGLRNSADYTEALVVQCGHELVSVKALEHMDQLRAHADALEELAALRAQLADALEENARLNKWADGMTDAALKERKTAEEYQRELREENARLRAELAKLRQMVAQQAEDDGLWFRAATAPEAYLQQELRRLHAAVEGAK